MGQAQRGDRRALFIAPSLVSVERWTVERLDQDAGMARIESVPIKAEHRTGDLLSRLERGGLEPDMDNLSLWAVDRARVRKMTVAVLRKKLGLQAGERETLNENMVFWVVRRTDGKGVERVYHATRAARQAAKQLYRLVVRREGRRS